MENKCIAEELEIFAKYLYDNEDFEVMSIKIVVEDEQGMKFTLEI